MNEEQMKNDLEKRRTVNNNQIYLIKNGEQMKKATKIMKAISLMVLLCGFTFAFMTGCKDYDDDIDTINGEIATLKDQASKIAGMQTTIETIQGKITSLETAVNAAATKEEVATLKGQIEVLETAKTALEGQITDLKGTTDGLDTRLKAAEATITELAGKLSNIEGMDLTALAATVKDLDTKVAQAILDIAAAQGAIELQQAVLGKYLEEGNSLVGDIEGLQAALKQAQEDLADLQANLVTAEDVDAAIKAAIEGLGDIDFEELQEAVDAINSGLNTLKTTMNSMVTSITLVSERPGVSLPSAYLDFTTAVAQVTYTFGSEYPNVAGQIQFTKGQRQQAAEDYVIIKVTPANAVIDFNKISIHRSDMNNTINDYIKPKAVERYTGLVTRGLPTHSGLWKVTYEVPATANVAVLKTLVVDGYGDDVLFAVGYENTVAEGDDAEERHVLSGFDFPVYVGDVDPIYNDQDAPNDLVFSVDGTSHQQLKNRYTTSEGGWTVPNDQKWRTGVWNTTTTPTVDDPDDNRLLTVQQGPMAGQATKFFAAEVNKAFKVTLDNPTEVYAYYVTLDRNWAMESAPSEFNAWNSYAYEGLNQVYKADEVANIKITSPEANGDIIGFRVMVINYDGTLVDPDGKAFYAYVGNVALNQVEFIQKITAYVPASTAVDTDIKAFAPGINLGNVSSANFSMTIGHNVVLDASNIALVDNNNNVIATADAATPANWQAMKKLQIVGVLPSDLEDNPIKTYTGTLTLNTQVGGGSSEVPFSVTTITLTKQLPIFDGNVMYKTSIHHDVNGKQVIYGYPTPPANQRYYNLATALNFFPENLTGYGYYVTNDNSATNYPANTLPTWAAAGITSNTNGVAVQAEIGVPYLEDATKEPKVYDLKLNKDFGYVLYNGSATYPTAWNPSIPVRVMFRSFVQDLTSWTWADPKLVYGVTPANYNLNQIKALPPAGPQTDMTKQAGGAVTAAPSFLQDNRTFEITKVELLTGTNFEISNEYYEPVLVGSGPHSYTAITFNAKNTSVPGAPVPTKFAITLKDDFGHSYRFVVPTAYNMKNNP